MKQCYVAHVGQVSNGIVVKVGCKIFVGESSDISLLETYYGGKIPDVLRIK